MYNCKDAKKLADKLREAVLRRNLGLPDELDTDDLGKAADELDHLVTEVDGVEGRYLNRIADLTDENSDLQASIDKKDEQFTELQEEVNAAEERADKQRKRAEEAERMLEELRAYDRRLDAALHRRGK
jgi:peptidoglycan hydrolase CwlO-like protein